MVAGGCKLKEDAEDSEWGSEGLDDCFGIGENFTDVVVVGIVVSGDNFEDSGEDVSNLFGFGCFLVDLTREDIDTTDGMGVTANAFFWEFVDIEG